jgi:hypothetical protein
MIEITERLESKEEWLSPELTHPFKTPLRNELKYPTNNANREITTQA